MVGITLHWWVEPPTSISLVHVATPKCPKYKYCHFCSNMYQHKTKMAFAIYLNSNCIFLCTNRKYVYVPTKKLSFFSTYFLYMCDQKKSTGFNCRNLVTQWLRFSSKNLGNMGEYESLWKSMKIYEHLWKSQISTKIITSEFMFRKEYLGARYFRPCHCDLVPETRARQDGDDEWLGPVHHRSILDSQHWLLCRPVKLC
jgi:hypothetical protein